MAIAASLAKKLDGLFKKTYPELQELRQKHSPDTVYGQQVRNEMDRRVDNKAAKKGDIDSEYRSFEFEQPRTGKKTPKAEKAADKDAEAFAMGKEQPAKKPTKSLTAAEKKAAEESLKFKKGGMVAKKKAPTKAKAKSTFSIKNNNFAK
jgi:hypothetical protein